MKEFNTEIDDISQKTQLLVERVEQWYAANGIDPKANYEKGATWINFSLGVDYYQSARKLLADGNILGGGNVLRTSLENTADIFFIVCEPSKIGRRSKAYVESIEAYRDAMRQLGVEMLDKKGERPMQTINSWTTASIYDRLQATGDSIVFVYDMFSYLSHPNPASMMFLTNEKFKNQMINVFQQANEFNILNTIAVTLNHSDIDTVKVEECEAIANQLGTTITTPNRPEQ